MRSEKIDVCECGTNKGILAIVINDSIFRIGKKTYCMFCDKDKFKEFRQ